MRLQGIDVARFIAFLGMVLVNFRIAAQVTTDADFPTLVTNSLEGRAAALFVILAGVGFTMGHASGRQPWHLTLRRAVFLFIIGMLDMVMFDADILHFYALYFLVGMLFTQASGRMLLLGAGAITLIGYIALFAFDFENGWNFETFKYADFWSISGFLRHSFYNGWHPVFPWAALFLIGMWVGRLDLAARGTQLRLLIWGGILATTTSLVSKTLGSLDPELIEIVSTAPIPPTPFYILAGSGTAIAMLGLILLITPILTRLHFTNLLAAPGKMSLTLYMAHIYLGMGILEGIGKLDGSLSAYDIFAISLGFCVIAALFARLWFIKFRRGPLEGLMRLTTEGKVR
ncbi:DUF418 domain-containing protein [Halocynthiibacter styelae]|uniref:DUF418 domain-containing protein n=1 Tax=Halocynthiibacter styelae TaxID=2761955 RepID=A0A8J7IQI2_9RHOB|nr:DUF418 domain-containing protein [Paenihalocynthiibacter styelae]MBI1493476.1 DUF418 domain-containing protein [Paenihalocynthiibacter styelae]